MALLSLIVPLVVFHFLFSQNNTGSIMQYEKNSKWFPLESNPQLLNQYIERLGFDTAQYQLIDIFSTEEWALNMIPRPVVAVILLYPLTDVQNEHAMMEETSRNVKDLWFIKQH
jgi:ubiquitin carboxyl-terminal hydrolase L3